GFNVAADYFHRSGDSVNGDHTISLWYVEGLLHLRGFFIGDDNRELRMIYSSLERPDRVIGYARHAGGIAPVRGESRRGLSGSLLGVPSDHPEPILAGLVTVPDVPTILLQLPKAAGSVITRLTPFGVTDPAHWLAPGKTLGRGQGSLQWADASSLVRELRQTEKPIQFLRMVEDSPRFFGSRGQDTDSAGGYGAP